MEESKVRITKEELREVGGGLPEAPAFTCVTPDGKAGASCAHPENKPCPPSMCPPIRR